MRNGGKNTAGVKMSKTCHEEIHRERGRKRETTHPVLSSGGGGENI